MIILIEGKNYIKTEKFCPNPVAQFGIPEYADSASFPNVIGTEAWSQWWDEQITRCIEGYNTGGMWISGRYYYYLNFAYLSTVGRGFHNPDFADTDFDFFNLVEYCKRNHRGIISIKARRRGLSFKSNKGIIEYGTKFLGDKYMGGICAGLKAYAEDFYSKLRDTEAITPPELQLNVLRSNDETRIYGYEQKNSTGGYFDSGSLNQILVRTAFQSGNVFKGTQLDDCIFEESGEFPNLAKTYEATKWCFMDGERMVGTPYIYGTGGNMNSSSKDFADFWANADALGLERFWVSGKKLYKPCWVGCTNTQGEIEHQVPNVLEANPGKDTKTELLGVEDYKEAERQIMLNRQLYSQMKDKQKLVEHMQNNPLTVTEAFISSAENNYDSEILQTRVMELMQMEDLHLDVVLDFKRDKDGKLVKPLATHIRLANTDPESPKRDPEWMICKLYEWPDPSIRFLDFTGIDSYDQDQSATSSSIGGVLVYRDKTELLKGNVGTGPIFTYYGRPPKKEQFYQIGMLAGLAYSGPNGTLIDANRPLIIDWAIENGLEYCLAYRPKTFESPNSKQVHTYGLKTTVSNRPQLEGLVQTEIAYNAQTWNSAELCRDCLLYNTSDMENDQDLHDALMLALALRKDRGLVPQLEKPVDKYEEPQVRETSEGYVYYDDVDDYDSDSPEGIISGDRFMQIVFGQRE